MDMEFISGLADILGFNIQITPVFIVFGMVFTAWFKDRWKITGRGIDVATIALVALMNGFAYVPQQNWTGLIFGTLICYMGATGAWAGAKQLLHKIGR